MTKAAKAARAINGLGNTPEEIAANLHGAGFKGVQYNGHECPCGACLREHFEAPIHVGSGSVGDGESKIRHPMSDAAMAFVHNFDIGKYPRLVRKGTK